MSTYKQGDLVEFNFGISGNGKICGISGNGVVLLGETYIIELLNPIDSFEFTHIAVPELYLKRATALIRDIILNNLV